MKPQRCRGKIGKNVGGCLRQPSGGPTMNVKGTAAGGGNALLMPMTEFSLGLTGDINDIMNAHNLAMVALNARMQHERNYDDEQLAKRGLKRLDIDPKRVEMGWVLDFCAQGLRNIITRETVDLPSPRGVGVMAVTSINLPSGLSFRRFMILIKSSLGVLP